MDRRARGVPGPLGVEEPRILRVRCRGLERGEEVRQRTKEKNKGNYIIQ